MTELMFDRALIALLLGMFGAVASTFIQRDTKSKSEKYAEIMRYARRRCLDELVALIREEKIEAGIGVDVERAYRLAVQAANKKGK